MSTSSKGFSSVEVARLQWRVYSLIFSCGLSLILSNFDLRGKKSKLDLYLSRKTRDKPNHVWSLSLFRFQNHLRAWPSRLDTNKWTYFKNVLTHNLLATHAMFLPLEAPLFQKWMLHRVSHFQKIFHHFVRMICILHVHIFKLFSKPKGIFTNN